ncbi:hypothetical protein C8R45DRAFT_921788 [Mycena sanguinolenta]|nr:hypothetical protein C8R45DRAFT_921788 [Mycena sanguinolenta]
MYHGSALCWIYTFLGLGATDASSATAANSWLAPQATQMIMCIPCTLRHIRSASTPIRAKFTLRKIRIARTGFVGICDDGGRLSPLEEFLAGGKHGDFTLVKSLGRLPRPILDSAGKVCGLYGGMPEEDDFMLSIHDAAVAAMEDARRQASPMPEELDHHQGTFVQVTGGNSFGGGQCRPGAMLNTAINTAIFVSLISHPAFQFFATFATELFASWAPNAFDFYVDYMTLFYQHYTNLAQPFKNGPRTCTRPHCDFNNLTFGWCAITALRKFDYTRGGHLVLWDCKLIIEFPPGCTILIPSAAILDLNIPIGLREHRYSFTQYTAGGLFQWVEQGFKSEEEYQASLMAQEREEEAELGLRRAAAGSDLFSTLAELDEMAA